MPTKAPDRFRMKITDSNGAVVVYDNKQGSSDDIDSDPQVISGGSIVTHK